MFTGNRVYATLFCLLFSGSIFFVYAQKPADAIAEVPELDAFHEVIFQIWHDAWPDKNISMLKRLTPEVEEGITHVVDATLPGILREKRESWDQGVQELRAAGDAYKTAAAGASDTQLLDAAEELHRRFEMLMRLIRPTLNELEDFHSSLYMLYHYYLPDFDLDKIRSSSKELQQKMEVLNQAALPDSLEEVRSDFQEARNKLAEAVALFGASLEEGSEDAIKKAILEVHSRYQAVMEICE